jgi:serine protease Do
MLDGKMNMLEKTKSLVAKAKRLAAPAGTLAVLLFAIAFLLDHNRACAASTNGPLDDATVAPLTALDNAVEALAAHVTPSVVNVAVTSRVEAKEQNFGGIDPEALPPGFRQFFFGQGGQQQPQIEHGVGSGVIISPDGYIVTNNHVVENATKITVTLDDKRAFTAKLVGVDKLNDLAVVKIDAKDLPAISWGDSTKLRPGQTVLALGSPFGYLQFSVTRGIISALDRPNPYSDDRRKPGDFIQVDAAINPGNSGGPLVNAHGELIGINTFIISNSGSFAGAGFAIPSQIVRASAESIIKSGTVHHGYLGITMNDVTPENAGFFNLPDASGALISQVVPDTPASKAGLKSGDVLRELNGKKIANSSALQLAVSETSPGAAIDLGIIRDGKPQTIHVTVGEFQGGKSDEAESGKSNEHEGSRLGLTVEKLSDEIRQQLNVPDRIKGVVVNSVKPGSAAEEAGIGRGSVILEVNRHAVESPESFTRQIDDAPKGKDVLLLLWAEGGAGYRVVHPQSDGDNDEK